jgi:calcium-translocating P-type ATPase
MLPATMGLQLSLPAHSLSPDQTVNELSSDARGLSNHEARGRLEQLGPNALPDEAPPSLWRIVARQFQSPLIYLLLVAAGLAFALGEHTDAIVILAVVLANALIGAFQEGRAERSMAALRRLTAVRARVLRDGNEQSLDARDLVPGDVILLAAGDAVPADARVLEEAALEVAEAVLTGESLPVAKEVDPLPADTALADRHNMLFAGTHVTAGRARAVVVATGSAAEVGKIAHLTAAAHGDKTPLERRIDQLGRYLLLGGLGVFAAVLAAGVARGLPWNEILLVGISQLVSVVPEGLPAAMTIALAVGMQRMAAQGAIVRKLSAVETLGSTSVICTDKTGTLTRNEMTVTTLRLPSGRALAITGTGYAPEGEVREGEQKLTADGDAELRALCEAVALCNDAELASTPEGIKPLGDPTEVALLTLAEKAGLGVAELRAQRPRSAELPFDSTTKMMATQHGEHVYVKGAPEAIAQLCPADSGAEATATTERALAAQALRVLAAGVAENTTLSAEEGFEALSGKVRLLGLIGQMDPPRPEVREVIAHCREAGIRTVMVTGDHAATGLAIARDVGIAREDDRAMTDAELEKAGSSGLPNLIENVAVFARVQPERKLRIVEAFKARGQVVAMTGDGVNDAPALARADVGVAMGITGTEVAKQAADIVITDDRFATIVAAVEQGRIVYSNLRKVILLLLSTGLAEVLVLIAAVALGYPLPFAAVQILWNNVITEGTITVNLTMDPAEGDEMKRPPIGMHEPIISRTMLQRMLLMAAVIATLTLGFFVVRLSLGTPFELARTSTFTLLAVCEWFNVLNCRSETHSALTLDVLRNRPLVFGILLSSLLQVAVVYLPALNQTFYTVPMPLSEVVLVGAVGSLVLWAEEIRKWFARRAGRQESRPASA